MDIELSMWNMHVHPNARGCPAKVWFMFNDRSNKYV